MQFCHCL